MATAFPIYKCKAKGCHKTATHRVLDKNGKSLGEFCQPCSMRVRSRQEKIERGIGRYAPWDGTLPPDTR